LVGAVITGRVTGAPAGNGATGADFVAGGVKDR